MDGVNLNVADVLFAEGYRALRDSIQEDPTAFQLSALHNYLKAGLTVDEAVNVLTDIYLEYCELKD